jgi:hypothetical protein
MDMTKTIFIAVFCSIFSLKQFSTVARKEIRVCVCFAMFISLYGYEITAFHNFAYLGISTVLLGFVINFSTLTKKAYITLVVLSVLLCLSKAYYIIYIPIAALYLVYSKKENNLRQLVFSIAIFLSSTLQSVYMITGNFANGPQVEDYIHFELSLFVKALYYYISIILAPLTQLIISDSLRRINGYLIYFTAIIIIASVLIISTTLLKNNKTKPYAFAAIIAIVSGYGMTLLTTISQKEIFKEAIINWGTIYTISPIHRHTVSAFSTILVLIIMLIALAKYHSKLKIFMVALIMISIAPKLITIQSMPITVDTWKYEARNLTNENFVFRMGTAFAGNNAKVLYWGKYRKDSGWTTNIGWFSAIPMQITEDKLMSSLRLINEDGHYPDGSNIESILTIYASKAYRSTQGDLYAKLFDENGKFITEIVGYNNRDSEYVLFTSYTSVPNVARVEFYGIDGAPLSLKPDFYVGVVNS